MQNWIKLLVIICVVFLVACSQELHQESIKMDDLLQQSNINKIYKLKHPSKNYSQLNDGFIRTQATELENKFPLLPNPTLNMFVFPHLTKYGNPVPGYTTNFKLYKSEQYALPHEVF